MLRIFSLSSILWPHADIVLEILFELYCRQTALNGSRRPFHGFTEMVSRQRLMSVNDITEFAVKQLPTGNWSFDDG